MTEKGYTPYCGSNCCSKNNPRTKFDVNSNQFYCGCGWRSSFPSDFINRYLKKWNISEEIKVLKLNLKYKWFDLMVKGIDFKREEIRKPTKWIEQRILNKDKQTYKRYDRIRFYRGYTSSYFETDYSHIIKSKHDFENQYSNGETVKIEKGDYLINYNKILCVNLN